MGRAAPLRPWEKGLGDEVDSRRRAEGRRQKIHLGEEQTPIVEKTSPMVNKRRI